MTSAVHVSAYLVRTQRGHYVKQDNGWEYVMFETRTQTKKFCEERNDGSYPVKVRVAYTPAQALTRIQRQELRK